MLKTCFLLRGVRLFCYVFLDNAFDMCCLNCIYLKETVILLDIGTQIGRIRQIDTDFCMNSTKNLRRIRENPSHPPNLCAYIQYDVGLNFFHKCVKRFSISPRQFSCFKRFVQLFRITQITECQHTNRCAVPL